MRVKQNQLGWMENLNLNLFFYVGIVHIVLTLCHCYYSLMLVIIIMPSAANTNPSVDCSLWLVIVAWNRFCISALSKNDDEICDKICTHLLEEHVIWIISATNSLKCPMDIALEAILFPDNDQEIYYAALQWGSS